MTNEYNVIGEHKENEEHLLVVGDDGRHYDYSLANERIEPVQQVDDQWTIDEPHEGEDDILLDVPGADLS